MGTEKPVLSTILKQVSDLSRFCFVLMGSSSVFLSLSFDLEAKVEGVADLVARLKGEGRLLCVCVCVCERVVSTQMVCVF